MSYNLLKQNQNQVENPNSEAVRHDTCPEQHAYRQSIRVPCQRQGFTSHVNHLNYIKKKPSPIGPFRDVQIKVASYQGRKSLTIA